MYQASDMYTVEFPTLQQRCKYVPGKEKYQNVMQNHSISQTPEIQPAQQQFSTVS